MLVITSKKYEVEETIKATNENGETLYEFVMQITPNEMGRIKKILIDENYKLSKEKDEDVIIEKATEMQEEFENIVFKEHKEPFKEKCTEYYYLETIDLIYNFFMSAFIEKKTFQVNTMSSNLKKITQN